MKLGGIGLPRSCSDSKLSEATAAVPVLVFVVSRSNSGESFAEC